MKVSGHVELVLRDLSGKVKLRRQGSNIITRLGLWLFGSNANPNTSDAEMEYAALGSGTGAPVDTDTALGTEIAGSRTVATGTSQRSQALTQLLGTMTVTWTFVITNPGPGTWNVNEVGLFNAATGPTMAARFLTQGFVMAAADVLTIEWTVEYAG